MITLERLKTLVRGDVICVPRIGRPDAQWRVNGMVKTWKRDPSRVRVPVKFGLYSYDAVTEQELDYLNKVGAYIRSNVSGCRETD